jgi:hypothetical protein
MSERKIVVPEGMEEAARNAYFSVLQKICASGGNKNSFAHEEIRRISLEAALLWLSENPIIPPPQTDIRCASFAVEWQRHMFFEQIVKYPTLKKVQQVVQEALSLEESIKIKEHIDMCTEQNPANEKAYIMRKKRTKAKR